MDLNTLKLFVSAADSGSLSEAARRTGTPLPTLSRRVRKLEGDVGVRLFERGPRGLVLTPAGTRLLAEVGPALTSIAQAEQRMRDEAGIAGTLRVSMPPHCAPLWEMFAEFGRRHPAVRFDVFVTQRRVDLAADGIDVVIRVGEGGYSSYVGTTLTRYRHRLVAAPELVGRNHIASPEELRSVPCACWRGEGPPVWTLGDEQVRLEPLLRTNDYLHLLQVARSGQAVTELPPFLARDSLERGALVELLPNYPMRVQPMRALVTDTRAMTPLVRQFLDFAAAAVPSALTG